MPRLSPAPVPARLPGLQALGVGLLAALLILVATWPWGAGLGSVLNTHWDTGLHAWKLNWNARHILDGGFLLPDYHGNFYYPQADTLALDDLFWLPSYFTALVLGLGGNPILAFNLTFLAMWSLSGAFTFLLLRELDLSPLASLLGGLAFCLLPYRVSYYLEFNGQLCFGIPLLAWLLVRYCRRPNLPNVLWLALAVWAQAVSALYYAVIGGLCLPLWALPFLAGRRELWRTPRFLLTTLAGVAAAALLAGVYLHPYYQLFHELKLHRSLADMAAHAAQPLTYLLDCSGFVSCETPLKLWRLVPALNAEATLWPGLGVLIPALVYLWRRRRVPGRGAEAPGAEPRWGLAARWLRLGCLAGFAAWLLVLAYGGAEVLPLAVGEWFLNACLLLALLAGVLLSLNPGEAGPRGRFALGLGSAGLLCFILSLGPEITVGHFRLAAHNQLVAWLYDYCLPVHATRVLTRYAIVPLFGLVVAAAMALDGLRLGRVRRRVLLLACLALMLLDASPLPSSPYEEPHLYPNPGLEAFLARREPVSLLVLPQGIREVDSHHMLFTAGTSKQRYLINGWTGFDHPYAHWLGELFSRGRLDRALPALARAWPDPLIVVDREFLARSAAEGHRLDEARLRALLPLLYEDPAVAVFAPPPPAGPQKEYLRVVRRDLMEKARVLEFWARTAAPGPREAVAALNGEAWAGFVLDDTWRQHRLLLPERPLRLTGNQLRLAPRDPAGADLEVREWRLLAQ